MDAESFRDNGVSSMHRIVQGDDRDTKLTYFTSLYVMLYFRIQPTSLPCEKCSAVTLFDRSFIAHLKPKVALYLSGSNSAFAKCNLIK